MTRDVFHIGRLFVLPIIVFTIGGMGYAQVLPQPPAAEPSTQALRTSAPADSVLFYEPVNRSLGTDYTPIYLPDKEDADRIRTAGTFDTGAQPGSADLLQPASSSGCASACSVSPTGSTTEPASEAGLTGRRTTALVLGTMSTAVSAMLVNRVGHAPGWKSAELLPHLSIGPAGGLYFGVHLAINFRE